MNYYVVQHIQMHVLWFWFENCVLYPYKSKRKHLIKHFHN